MKPVRASRKPLNLAKIQKLSNQIIEVERQVRLEAHKLAATWSQLVKLTDSLYVETDATAVAARKLLTRIDRITGFTPLIEVGSDGVHAIHIISTSAAVRGDHLAVEKPEITQFRQEQEQEDNEW